MAGDVAIIDPITGEFLQVFDEDAARIYVADVSGDNREEIVVLNSRLNEIHVYTNPQPAKGENGPSPSSPASQASNWERNYYKRQKMNYNYYSP